MNLRLGALFLGLAMPLSAIAQQPVSAMPEAQLRLTVETATTDDNGNPTSLRITLTNEGNADVTMPVLGDGGCSSGQRLQVEVLFKPDDPSHGQGTGFGCGYGSEGPLLQRVKRSWVQLRPGEFMSATLALRPAAGEPGTVDYWVRYEPAQAGIRELLEVWNAGYIIPRKILQSEHKSFHIP